MPYTRPLDELRRADEPRFGGKSASLGELLRGRDPGAARVRDLDRAHARRGSRTGGESRHGESAGLRSGDGDESPERRSATRSPAATASSAQAHGGAAPPVAVRSSALGEDSPRRRSPASRRPTCGCAACDAVVRRRARLLGEPLQPAGDQLPRAARRPADRRDGRRRAADGRRRGLGRDVHLQPGQRRPEHGRDQRQLGARRWRSSAAR